MGRRVRVDQAARYLRDEFKLSGWVKKPAARRREYFGWCDDVVTRLKSLLGGDDPDDDSVVLAIAAMLNSDDTFTAHISGAKGASFLAESDNWVRIRHAAASQIYQEYLDAKEKGEWPENRA